MIKMHQEIYQFPPNQQPQFPPNQQQQFPPNQQQQFPIQQQPTVQHIVVLQIPSK